MGGWVRGWTCNDFHWGFRSPAPGNVLQYEQSLWKAYGDRVMGSICFKAFWWAVADEYVECRIVNLGSRSELELGLVVHALLPPLD